MKIYLVGGAIRDQLLGLAVKERDWVVVGASVADMLKLGYKQVGKEFPVFLHLKTSEEYALARMEQKTKPGYKGFEFDTSPEVSLVDDLKRRDLTINAMAQTLEGELIDPYHGKIDLEKKILRHVSAAFVEDPVRILRLARFAARYFYLGFQVAPETVQLMREMVHSSEVDALVPERVFKELDRALSEKNPEIFFEVLKSCGAFSVLFPELIDHDMSVLKRATEQSADTMIRFTTIFSATPEAAVNTFCNRYRIPTHYRELALLISRFLKSYERLAALSAREIIELLQSVDAFRREQRFKKFLLAGDIILQTELSSTLMHYYEQAKAINIPALIQETKLSGKALAEKIREARVAALTSGMR